MPNLNRQQLINSKNWKSVETSTLNLPSVVVKGIAEMEKYER